MDSTVDLQLKDDFLQAHNLPDIAYPVPSSWLADTASSGGELPLAVLLHGLQLKSGQSADWQSLEPAMLRLAQQLAPQNNEPILSAAGDNWWIEIGPVDLHKKVITIQRDFSLIAALQPTDYGQLRLATYQPLDGRSISLLLSLAQRPVNGQVCMRENNWEYALDCSAGTGQIYASDDGRSYLSFWEKGIGISWDNSLVADWHRYADHHPQPANQTVAELGVYYSLSGPEPDSRIEPERSAGEVRREPAATRPLWTPKRRSAKSAQSRFLGCLLGGAAGDALGGAVEFMQREDILKEFGSKGITRYAPAYGGPGKITDDTQMTLFTAEGLLRGWVRGCHKGMTDYACTTANAYLRWLLTQGIRPAPSLFLEHENEPGWLIQHNELHNRRAPGNTCLSALENMTSLGEPARNNSKGCGGVMRVAPVGLFFWRIGKTESLDEAFQTGCELAEITHHHPTGYLTAGVLAVLVLALVDGASLPEALDTAKSMLLQHPGHEETYRAIEQAERAARYDQPPEEAIAELGQGWVAEEALAIGIYCALVAPTLRQGVILAVNHSGDSDSTGAIAGNLLGAMNGAKAVPKTWLDTLELKAVIEEMATDLYAFKDWSIGPYNTSRQGEEIWRKYPGF